jgi:hypothetical protein
MSIHFFFVQPKAKTPFFTSSLYTFASYPLSVTPMIFNALQVWWCSRKRVNFPREELFISSRTKIIFLANKFLEHNEKNLSTSRQ